MLKSLSSFCKLIISYLNSIKLTISNILFRQQAAVDFVPEDIIENILTRLPVKSLCRFKCVSKSWLSLISSERFVKSHWILYSPNTPRVLINPGYPYSGLKHCSLDYFMSDTVSTEPIDIDYPIEIEVGMSPTHVSVVGSCNGLVCVYCRPDLYLWNPTVKKVYKLPPVNNDDTYWKGRKYEFVYDAKDDDYKVLCLFHATGGNVEANVFSWRANSWKTRVCTNSGVSFIFSSQLKYLAGKIHIGTRPPIVYDIISWDVENDVYGTIEQPDYGEGVGALVMREVGGWLCGACLKGTNIDLWAMKEYGVKESWSKMLTVSLLDDGYVKRIRIGDNPFVMLPSGEILVVFNDCFDVYNLKDGSMRVLDATRFGEYEIVNLYVESLVSPTQHME